LGLYLARELCAYNQAKLNHRAGEPTGSVFRITFVAPLKPA
jgi:signal transduction histidine kinase